MSNVPLDPGDAVRVGASMTRSAWHAPVVTKVATAATIKLAARRRFPFATFLDAALIVLKDANWRLTAPLLD
jgi:hypothetical protein